MLVNSSVLVSDDPCLHTHVISCTGESMLRGIIGPPHLGMLGVVASSKVS